MVGDLETNHLRDFSIVALHLAFDVGIVSTLVQILNPYDLADSVEQFIR